MKESFRVEDRMLEVPIQYNIDIILPDVMKDASPVQKAQYFHDVKKHIIQVLQDSLEEEE